MDVSSKDDDLVSLAIDPQVRGRYRSLLANPKRRKKFLDDLNHHPRLDERRAKWYSSFSKAIEAVKVKPDTAVYVISATPELDGQAMPYAQAIEDVPFHGWGSIILISPNLALYYGEQGESAAVIQKHA